MWNKDAAVETSPTPWLWWTVTVDPRLWKSRKISTLDIYTRYSVDTADQCHGAIQYTAGMGDMHKFYNGSVFSL